MVLPSWSFLVVASVVVVIVFEIAVEVVQLRWVLAAVAIVVVIVAWVAIEWYAVAYSVGY